MMILSEQKKIWKCTSCQTYFFPDHTDFSCPKCTAHTTRQTHDFDQSQHNIWGIKYQDMKVCSGCGQIMSPGYIVNSKGKPSYSIDQGLYWEPIGSIKKVSPIPLNAYACPKCGRTELFTQKKR